jgi:hypothetical protein
MYPSLPVMIAATTKIEPKKKKPKNLILKILKMKKSLIMIKKTQIKKRQVKMKIQKKIV